LLQSSVVCCLLGTWQLSPSGGSLTCNKQPAPLVSWLLTSSSSPAPSSLTFGSLSAPRWRWPLSLWPKCCSKLLIKLLYSHSLTHMWEPDWILRFKHWHRVYLHSLWSYLYNTSCITFEFKRYTHTRRIKIKLNLKKFDIDLRKSPIKIH